jgi:hypothetical protein
MHRVEQKIDLGWRRVFGACGTRQFCNGWIAAMDSCYPSNPFRIVAAFADGSTEIVHETKGRGNVHLA